MTALRILHWNTQKSKKAQIPAVDAISEEYDVLAIQEPWRNPHMPTTYCPRSSPYYLLYATEGGRACIYINKKYPPAQWTYKAQPDRCNLTIQLPDGPITVICVYSPPPGSTSRSDLPAIEALHAEPQPRRTVLVGDFNVHHPVWGGYNVRPHKAADKLLQLAESWRLQLITPPGTPTWTRRGCMDSTIDLAWATDDLRAAYDGYAPYAGSDHLPQAIRVAGLRTDRQDRPRRSWKTADYNQAKAEAAHLPQPGRLETPEEIDSYTETLTKELTRIADLVAPLRHSKGRGKA